jgi:C1A family cysteine protease
MDVYCLEVPQYHNFALAAGVFVHNCTAHAVAGVIEYNDKRFNSKPVNKRISRLFTYYATRILEGTVNEDSGASMRNAIKSVANFGCIRESLWWYNEKKFTVNPPQKLWKAAATDKILSYHRIDDGDLATIKSTLAHGYVIAFGMQVFNAMLTEEVAKSGIVPTPNENETNVGGHAVVLVGYDDTKQMFKVRNSWGKNWGDCGYFWLGYDYVGSRELCNDFWVVVSSVDVS